MHKRKYLWGGGVTQTASNPTGNPLGTSDPYSFDRLSGQNKQFGIDGAIARSIQMPKIEMPKLPNLMPNGLKLPKSVLGGIGKSSVAPFTGGGGKGKSSMSSFMSSPGFSMGMQAFDAVSGMIPSADKNVNSLDETMGGVRSGINGALMKSGNPFAMAAGAINTVIDKTGGFTDASKGLGGGTDTLNAISSLALPGVGWFTKKTDKVDAGAKSTVQDTSNGSFEGLLHGKSATTADNNSNAKILFGKGKANRLIGEQNQKLNQARTVLNDSAESRLAASNSSGIMMNKSIFNQMGGAQSFYTNAAAVGKKGMKVQFTSESEFAKKALSKKAKRLEEVRMEEVASMKEGGQFNVIPSGALHSNKHHLEDVDDSLKEVTPKGIPVVTAEDGDIIQHAEVERDEIIFNLDVTETLEKLMGKGSDDAAIEAGKLLVKEILENTVDNTGLLNKIE